MGLPKSAIGAPHEFALACACAAWPPSRRRDAAVTAAAARVSDWTRFMGVVRRHRMEAMAHHALTTAGVGLPADVADLLARRADFVARQTLVMAAESVRLQALLDQAGICNLILKGSVITALAYGNAPVKHAHDIDILVPPEAVERALLILNAAGYRIVLPGDRLTAEQIRTCLAVGREFLLVGAGRTFVELKWVLDMNPALLAGFSARSRSQWVAGPGGASIRTLTRDDIFSHLCVHGGRHCFSRLKWLADIAALLGHEPPEEIERLYQAARRCGAGRSAAAALLLCARFFALPLSSSLAAELERDRAAAWLVRASVFVMAGGDGLMEVPRRRIATALGQLAQFLVGEGWAFLGAEYRRGWIHQGDRLSYPLPRWAWFLYPIIRAPLFVWRRIAHTVSPNAQGFRPGPGSRGMGSRPATLELFVRRKVKSSTERG